MSGQNLIKLKRRIRNMGGEILPVNSVRLESGILVNTKWRLAYTWLIFLSVGIGLLGVAPHIWFSWEAFMIIAHAQLQALQPHPRLNQQLRPHHR